MKWTNLEALKDLGGMGFGNLIFKNLGLLTKWWLRFSIEVEPLWKRMVKTTNEIRSSISSWDEFSQVKEGTFLRQSSKSKMVMVRKHH